MNVYHCFECVVLLVLVLRIFIYFARGLKLKYDNFDAFLYLFFVLINSIAHLFIKDILLLNSLYDSFLPATLFLFFIIRNKLNKSWILVSVLFFSIVIYNFNNNYINLFLYLCAMLFMLYRAVVLGSQSSNNLKISPLYVMFSIDLLFSILTMQLAYTSCNWQNSYLINYLGVFSLFIFSSTLILFHVYIRRFFVA